MMPAAHVSGPNRPLDEAAVQARLAALRARVASLENEPPTAAQTTAEQQRAAASHVIIPHLIVCDDSGAYADEPFELPEGPSGEVMGERLALMEERLRETITERLKSEIKEAVMAEVADLLSKDRYDDGARRRSSLCCSCL